MFYLAEQYKFGFCVRGSSIEPFQILCLPPLWQTSQRCLCIQGWKLPAIYFVVSIPLYSHLCFLIVTPVFASILAYLFSFKHIFCTIISICIFTIFFHSSTLMKGVTLDAYSPAAICLYWVCHSLYYFFFCVNTIFTLFLPKGLQP